MTQEKRASLALETGTVLHGSACGAPGERSGDIVFNTAMSGYHEILTDPSYAGQAVIMTYPLIGNYGVAEEDAESRAAWPEAFIMREMTSLHSNHRAQGSDRIGRKRKKKWIRRRHTIIDRRHKVTHLMQHQDQHHAEHIDQSRIPVGQDHLPDFQQTSKPHRIVKRFKKVGIPQRNSNPKS